MKAPAAQQRRLLDLANTDAEIARLRHQRSHLPEDAALAEREAALETARGDAGRARLAAEDLDREYDRLEQELTGMIEHAARDQVAIDAGAVGHKALAEMQHELTGLRRRRDRLEGELLELMEQQEATGAERDRAAATVTAVTAEIAEALAQRDAAAARIDGKIEDAITSREALRAELPTELTVIYDRVRARGQVGAGLVRQRRCGACRMELDPRSLSRIATAAEDDVLLCEECGAIVVRTEQSGLP